MNKLDHDQCEHGFLECVKKPSPPPFLLKTYMLVDDPTNNDTISWNSDGTAFVVWEPAEFSTHLLPTLFKHCNFSSFVRQLNTYGFRKVATNRWEFQNNMFRRGEPELLCNIRRRRPWESKLSLPGPMPMAAAEEDRGSSSTSSSSEHNSLLDENKRLKKENWVLTCELKSVKRKCKELLDLVERVKRSAGIDVDEDCQYKSYKDERPKLFGVRLEVAEEEEEIHSVVRISKSIAPVLLGNSMCTSKANDILIVETRN